MLEGLVVAFVASWAVAYVVYGLISWWDELHCPTHWESLIRYHSGLLQPANCLGRHYHAWRIKVAERKLARWNRTIQYKIQALMNTPQPSQSPEPEESSRPY